MFADALGQPIRLCLEPEASARGAAIMALRALGTWRTLADYPPQFGATFEPDEKQHERFSVALERQQRLYKLAKGWEQSG
jgi:gluconokinase